MKFIFVNLPTLLLTICVAILHAQGSAGKPALSEEQRRAELRDVRREFDLISAKLTALESRSGAVLPRGIGPESVKQVIPHALKATRLNAPDRSYHPVAGDIHA